MSVAPSRPAQTLTREAPGATQTVCPECGGTGDMGGEECPVCDGVGLVLVVPDH